MSVLRFAQPGLRRMASSGVKPPRANPVARRVSTKASLLCDIYFVIPPTNDAQLIVPAGRITIARAACPAISLAQAPKLVDDVTSPIAPLSQLQGFAMVEALGLVSVMGAVFAGNAATAAAKYLAGARHTSLDSAMLVAPAAMLGTMAATAAAARLLAAYLPALVHLAE